MGASGEELTAVELDPGAPPAFPQAVGGARARRPDPARPRLALHLDPPQPADPRHPPGARQIQGAGGAAAQPDDPAGRDRRHDGDRPPARPRAARRPGARRRGAGQLDRDPGGRCLATTPGPTRSRWRSTAPPWRRWASRSIEADLLAADGDLIRHDSEKLAAAVLELTPPGAIPATRGGGGDARQRCASRVQENEPHATPAGVAVILAAGKGTRMKSRPAEGAPRAAGRPLLAWVVDAARAAGCERILVVVGHGAERVREEIAGRRSRLGAPGRAEAAPATRSPRPRPEIPGEATVLVLSGDVPLVQPATLDRLAAAAEARLGRPGGRRARRAGLARPGDRGATAAFRRHRRGQATPPPSSWPCG